MTLANDVTIHGYPAVGTSRLAELERENAEMRAWIRSQEAAAVTLCFVCEKPVWPTWTLYQQLHHGDVVYGHTACLSGQEPSSD